MKTKSVIVSEPTVAYDAERNATSTFATATTLNGYLIPETGDTVQKLNGVDVQVTDRFILKGQSAYLVVGNRLTSSGQVFDIVWVGNYGKAVDVKLRAVV